jgi:hypothetical protein
MTKEQAQFIQKATIACGNQECEIRNDYSGRGMYGQKTHAIVINNVNDMFADIINYIKDCEVPYDEIPYFEDLSTDNMGLDTVIY